MHVEHVAMACELESITVVTVVTVTVAAVHVLRFWPCEQGPGMAGQTIETDNCEQISSCELRKSKLLYNQALVSLQ